MTEEQLITIAQPVQDLLIRGLLNAGYDLSSEDFWREYWAAMLLLVYRMVSGDGSFNRPGTENNINQFADNLKFIANGHFTEKMDIH